MQSGTSKSEQPFIYHSEADIFREEHQYIHTYLHPNYHYKLHSHQFYEINIIATGRGRHYIENTSLDIAAGDIFVIPPDVLHGYDSEYHLNIYHILIKTDFFTRYREELSQIDGFDLLFDIEPQIRRASGKRLRANAADQVFHVFDQDLKRLIELEKQKKYVYLNVMTLAFICKLCEWITDDISDSYERSVAGVMEYIKNNLDGKLTLEVLSRYAHVSAATLNRQFREAVMQTPMQYVTACRIAKAKRLIAEGQSNRTEIAQACGFYDSSHMNKYL